MTESDFINPEQAGTLPGLFRERVRRTPDRIAYKHYEPENQAWVDSRWRETESEIGRWQGALSRAALQPGDRVAMMLRNGPEWVLFDQAAMGLGLVTVPLYTDDRAENAAYILKNAGVKLLLVEGRHQWQELLKTADGLPTVEHILCIHPITKEERPADPRLVSLREWMPERETPVQRAEVSPDTLATIVYTSGTTGYPKGVMLSHRNILSNAAYALQSVDLHKESETFLSFLPLSHTLERTIGYYLATMAGGTVAFNRSIKQLPEDLIEIRPTVLISVPRIYERVYTRVIENVAQQAAWRRGLFDLTLFVGWRRYRYRQGLASWSPWLLLWPVLFKLVAGKIIGRLGGRIRFAICGGAALQPDINRFFVSMGLPILQGYGLTEASPVVSVNTLAHNRLGSIGHPVPGVQARIAENGELQTRSDCVMLGYWGNPEATKAAFTEDGWLRTGDMARMDEQGFFYITGRLKDIIVLSNGEKAPPVDMENAITLDPLFEQAMVLGEGRPYLAAVVVLNPEVWRKFAAEHGADPADKAVLERGDIESQLVERIGDCLKQFPGYAQIRLVHFVLEPWTVEEGLLTPTLKIKRNKILEKYAAEIEKLYAE